MKNEEWKEIPGFTEYLVSNHGRFKSLDRIVRAGPGSGKRIIKGRIINPWINKHGYLQVGTWKRKRFNLHYLVAFCFCDGYKKGLVVNHKNGIKTDNRKENLEWITISENTLHSYRVLLNKPSCSGLFGSNHPKSKPIIAKNLKNGLITKFDCGMDAIRSGIAKDSGLISKCCKGINKSYNGYEFSYA